MEIAGICNVIVYEAHGHAKHANTRGSGACPLGNFETLSEIESEGNFSDLSPFNAPVDTGTGYTKRLTMLQLASYLHAIHAVIQLLFI